MRLSRAATATQDREIARLTAQGLTPPEIASKLGISTSTVYRRRPGYQARDPLGQRILSALQEKPYDNTHDLIRDIAEPGENLGYLQVTTTLHKLRKRGLIRFRETPLGAVSKNHSMTGSMPFRIQFARPDNVNGHTPIVEESTIPEPVAAPPEPVSEPPIAEVVAAITEEWHAYPAIRSLLARKQALDELMALAERTGDDDIQLLVIQKMEFSPLEREVIDHWAKEHA